MESFSVTPGFKRAGHTGSVTTGEAPSALDGCLSFSAELQSLLCHLNIFMLLAEVCLVISLLPVASRVRPLLSRSGRAMHASPCMQGVSTSAKNGGAGTEAACASTETPAPAWRGVSTEASFFSP